MSRSLVRPASLVGFTVIAAACQPAPAAQVDPAHRQALADTLTTMIRSSYDLKAANPDQIAVGCPFCMTMINDAVNQTTKEGASKIEVKDVSEILVERLGGGS